MADLTDHPMNTPPVPMTAPESDQDEAALRDNAERVAANDFTPVVLPGAVANATTNIGGIVSMGASPVAGLTAGVLSQEIQEGDVGLPAIKSPYRLAPDNGEADEDIATGGVLPRRD